MAAIFAPPLGSPLIEQIAAKDAVLKSMAGTPIYIPPVRTDFQPAAVPAAAQPSAIKSARSDSFAGIRSSRADSASSLSIASNITEPSLSDSHSVEFPPTPDLTDDISLSSSGSSATSSSGSDSERIAQYARQKALQQLKHEKLFAKQRSKMQISKCTDSACFCVQRPNSELGCAAPIESVAPRSQLSVDLEKLLTCERLFDFTIYTADVRADPY